MSVALSTETFSAGEQDVLREIVNIAMGRAGSTLAQVLNAFVTLSIPRIRIMDTAGLKHLVADLVGGDVGVVAVRQGFYSQPRGEAITIFDKERCAAIAEPMGYQRQAKEFVEPELLLDVGNLLVGACMNGIAEQLGTRLSFSAPSILAEGNGIDCMLDVDAVEWTCMLLTEIHFALESQGPLCHLILLTNQEFLDAVRREYGGILDAM